MAHSLRTRLVMLLLLANLPAAALAIGATFKAQSAVVSQRERSVVQKAELIATRAGLTLGIAEGVADTLSANPEIAAGSPACSYILEAALKLRPEYGGIVVTDKNGDIACRGGDTRLDATRHSSLTRALASEASIGDTVFLPETINAKDEFVLASRPFNDIYGNRRAVGLMIRRQAFDDIFKTSSDKGNGALALIRGGGNVVSEFDSGELGDKWRPTKPLPVGMPGDAASGLTFASSGGEDFYYAVAPVRGTMSNVVLATPLSILSATDWSRVGTALLAPLMMMILGITAIFAGVDRLVLRWIARLRTVTGSYSRGDYSPRIEGLDHAPAEIADLGTSFNVMAGKIEERSHALQEALNGKNLLLRELHHRVKNNFQMIASLLALQRRELPSRLRTLLRVPEDRVLAMASAYKASYATGEIGRVSLLDLLRDIAAQLRQSFGLAPPILKLRAEAEAVWLDLDRAVPLGLLVSEILSAALDRDEAATRPMEIAIHRVDTGAMRVEITSEGLADAVPTMGLAARLVRAYQAQLGATLDTVGEDCIRISMSIDAEAPVHPGRVELGG